MAFPKPFVEWLMYAHLVDHKDHQLLILKGHLMLDVWLLEVVRDEKLSFYSKVKKFEMMTQKSELSNFLLSLNSMRNKLAHELLFDADESGLCQWSEDVLEKIPYTPTGRRTERLKIIHAMSALAGAVYVCSDHSKGEQQNDIN